MAPTQAEASLTPLPTPLPRPVLAQGFPCPLSFLSQLVSSACLSILRDPRLTHPGVRSESCLFKIQTKLETPDHQRTKPEMWTRWRKAALCWVMARGVLGGHRNSCHLELVRLVASLDPGNWPAHWGTCDSWNVFCSTCQQNLACQVVSRWHLVAAAWWR